ncbi:hypothetical protein, partial [Tahibacter caeni]|uniref:hypothetical protein n=1 Tax=Tahibacter caeni TaxID=1453545 RepID=UPI0021495263
ALLPLAAAAQEPRDSAAAVADGPGRPLAGADPNLMLTNDDSVALVTGSRQPCRSDVLEAHFHQGRFAFEGGLLETGALVEAIRQRKTRRPVACLRVTGPYDRTAFDALGNALVDPVGVSLSWDRPQP